MRAMAFAAPGLVAKDKIPPLNAQGTSVNQRLSQLSPCLIDNAGHGGAGDPHLLCAFFLRETLEIDQADGFVFFHPAASPARRTDFPPGEKIPCEKAAGTPDDICEAWACSHSLLIDICR